MPSLIPKQTQIHLLSRLLHRDLADQRHKTNVHLHHFVPYQATHLSSSVPSHSEIEMSQNSFFNMSPKCLKPFIPLNPDVHEPFTVSEFLNRKLRWVTLGGQYNWTQKEYPPENPDFPTDLAAFTQSLFPEMKAQAAIVNVYSPGDTLSIHRDVSEQSDNGLVSISLGCDGVFVAGLGSKEDENAKSIAIRLRSGDAIYMSSDARYAWHGVPQIIPDTCPEWLGCWPAKENAKGVEDDVSDLYEPWRDWMYKKRINLNIRQMRD